MGKLLCCLYVMCLSSNASLVFMHSTLETWPRKQPPHCSYPAHQRVLFICCVLQVHNVCCSLLNELECNMAIHTGVAIAGKRAVVVGRSDIVVNEICRKLHACIQTNTEIVANRVRQLPRCLLLNTLQSLFVILAPRILNPL